MVRLETMLNLHLVNCNYAMDCSMIIVLIHYAYNYSSSVLCIGGSMGISRYFNSTSSVLLLFRISKPHLVQGRSTRLANHMDAWTRTCKNGGYHYFMHLYPVVSVIQCQCQSILAQVSCVKAILNITH